MSLHRRSPSGLSSFWFAAAVLLNSSIACNMFAQEEPLYTPEKPTQYTAEVQTVHEVYILVDEGGNMVDFGGPYAYGVNANMRYVLRFWDVGSRMEGYGAAEIYKIYTPVRVTGVNQELEEGMTDEQKAEIYARTAFPSTEVKSAEMQFAGGTDGTFLGTNLETGKEIYGYLDWREKEWEMHACIYYDVMKHGCTQDFLVLAEEPFYNWP